MPGSVDVNTQSLSPKGRRTRERLLAGARRAFGESRSYVDTRITDIAKESGVAYGSFYTYFDSKEHLFYELAASVVNEMYEEGTSRYRGDDPIERIDSANRQFLASYQAHAVMMTIIEQAAALYPELRELRRELRGSFVERIRVNIERWQSRGLVDRALATDRGIAVQEVPYAALRERLLADGQVLSAGDKPGMRGALTPQP